MRLIKVSTELEISDYEFPVGSYAEQNKFFCKLIGNNCDTCEQVLPSRLYTVLGHEFNLTNTPGENVCMLVDEDGLLKTGMKLNILGCFLYRTDEHLSPIMGNVLLVGRRWGKMALNFVE
ncbi:MAG: hypothetical protein IJ733_08750 [Lachnospiraceae bacterium]|nr:hypothetical protein [Lachnospiraceae bacterium]